MMRSEEPSVARIERDVVLVEGSDARSYLQTQLTQDVEGIPLGGSRWSFILDPKSSIEAFVRVTRIGHDRLALDIEPGFGHRVRERLDGLLFRTDVRFATDTWTGIAWRGPGAATRRLDAPVVATVPWQDTEALDIIGPGVEPSSTDALLSAEDLEVLRIRSGWPAMGFELGPGITPAMTGLVDITVSFDKGCYTGQELVARTFHRGAAPTKRLVKLVSDTELARGERLTMDGDDVGEVTSAAGSIGLGYLIRRVDDPSEVQLGASSRTVQVAASHH